MPTDADRRTLTTLGRQLGEGKVQVRVYTRQPLHGKTYLLHQSNLETPVVGFVGSSNLTGPGLRSNTELNVDVLDNNATEDLEKWFLKHWDDDFCVDITQDIIDAIAESWAGDPVRPFDVFMKVCYDLSADARTGQAEYRVPDRVRQVLLGFQDTAVRTLARRLMTRGGVMLGDVVGLGKTLTATAVAATLFDQDVSMQPLVICPLNLVTMWRNVLDQYEMPGRVVSYSTVVRDLPEMRRYPLVIIDESHTLRNASRQDYAAVRDYIHVNESKVLALTATPYNKEFSDVADQLGLWIDDDADLGISPVNALAADPDLDQKVDGKITTLAAFRRSEDPGDWQRLMSENLIRRTRSFIISNYAHTGDDGLPYLEYTDGRRFTFPTRKAIPIRHTFAADDPALLMSDDSTLDAIKGLQMPRYRLADYLPATGATPAETKWIDDVHRGRGRAAGFVRTTMYKRLSSGGWAFICTLRRHIARNQLFIYALEHQLPVPTGSSPNTAVDTDLDTESGDETGLQRQVADRYQNLADANPAQITWVRPGLFRGPLAADLAADTAVLQALLDRYGPWTPGRDSKLQALIHLATQSHPAEKILVFTEYSDTANYLAAQLGAAGIDHVGVVTGETKDPTALARRFSPRSTAAAGSGQQQAGPSIPPDEELRILVATDVVSEGQNLQDAHVVVNYDLPWAIIRLIQRAGRVDRMGQTSDTVWIYTMVHDNLEEVLNLRQRISHRLANNAQVFGSDEKFFGGPDETRLLAGLYNGRFDDADAEGEDDVDAASLAYEYWRNAVATDPSLADRIPRMPDLVDATRPRQPIDAESGVACYVRTASGLDAFGLNPVDADPRILTGHEALRAFRADPSTPANLPRRFDHDDKVAELVRGPLKTPQAVGGIRGVRRRVWEAIGPDTALFHGYDSDTQAAIMACYQQPLTATAENQLRAVLRRRDFDLLARTVTNLWAADALTAPITTGTDPLRIITSMGIQDLQS
ncbi:MAG: phospholipase D-like domain-containing protein [Acidipropionibacterium acidipropionici]|nr:phospholipase D-like domain-containing protein [Acidipropionibacterium acidipropionici]